ncbi:MAG: TCR/Tet family MFS transporter [Pirellulaceae bacterium]|nr:TCR/Tet family MFS transporter [Pirellulaceae bacterium]
MVSSPIHAIEQNATDCGHITPQWIDSSLNSPRKAAIWFILISVLLDVLSFGVLIPVLPRVIKEFTGQDESQAAMYVGLFGTVWAFMHFFCAPILGSLSDQYGRRRVLLISCFGLGIDYVLMALAPNLTWLFVGRIISGITAAGFGTAAAYIADVTVPEKRAAAFGLFGAAFGTGFVIGPALGGALGEFDIRLPFWVAAALTLTNAAYGYFILPESLALEHRKPFSWARANPIGSLRLLQSQSGLLGLAMVYFLYQLAHQVLNNVFVLYTGHRYAWTPITVGLALGLVGTLNIVVQGGLVRPALKRFGEQWLLFIGLFCGVAGYALYGLADQSWKFWAATPIFSLMAFFTPAIQGLMSRRLGPSVQGQLQGANGSLMGIAGMIGPGLFSGIYAYSVNPETPLSFPGMPFLVASGCLVIAIFIAGKTLHIKAA